MSSVEITPSLTESKFDSEIFSLPPPLKSKRFAFSILTCSLKEEVLTNMAKFSYMSLSKKDDSMGDNSANIALKKKASDSLTNNGLKKDQKVYSKRKA